MNQRIVLLLVLSIGMSVAAVEQESNWDLTKFYLRRAAYVVAVAAVLDALFHPNKESWVEESCVSVYALLLCIDSWRQTNKVEELKQKLKIDTSFMSDTIRVPTQQEKLTT